KNAPQIKNTSHLGYICPLKNTPNFQKSTFGMQSEVKMHPKSRIRAIWDTFAPSNTHQIFKRALLGCNLKQKSTPNQEYEPFGIHLLPQKHPKFSKEHIWDAIKSNLSFLRFCKASKISNKPKSSIL
ncbi:MAG: hypothetical protein IJK83_05475, partial [Clostridiales bacterium]|nr:hypothetical protein [Clostridiales bacterium]